MSVKKLNLITITFVIDYEEHIKTFMVNKEAKKEDAEAIGTVMQKWITGSLENLL